MTSHLLLSEEKEITALEQEGKWFAPELAWWLHGYDYV